MNTIKASSIRLYFFNTDDPKKVVCKLCRTRLGSERTFNLKKHLKHVHNIEASEVRLKKGKRHIKDPEFIKDEFDEPNNEESSTTIVVNDALVTNEESNDETSEALETSEHIISDPVPPLIPFERTPAKPSTNEVTVQDNFEHVDPLATKSVFNLNSDSRELHNVSISNNNNVAEPQLKENEKIMIEGNIFEVTQPSRNYKRTKAPKRKSLMKDNTITVNDNSTSDIQPPPSSPKKDDDFNEVFMKRKQLTELEYLQMQNYKMKLELWALEQKLQVKNSKFTKDIVPRKLKKQTT